MLARGPWNRLGRYNDAVFGRAFDLWVEGSEVCLLWYRLVMHHE